MITASGVGSGLDINSIITKLMSIERQPLLQLQKQESQFNAQLSAYGKVKSALSDFQSAMSALGDASKFQIFSATSSNEEAFTAVADSSANIGSYSVSVGQLAQAHKVKTADGAFATSTDVVSVPGGDLSVDVGGSAFTVTIGAGGTLEDVRDAINSSVDNTGVTATIINGTGTSNLVLTSNNTGASNAITVTALHPSLSAFDSVGGLEQITGAQDAAYTIDGIAGTSASNTVTGALTGVTIDLLQQGAAATGTLTVGQDTAAVKDSIQAFADAFNNLRKTISDLHKEGGALEGENTLLSLDRQLMGVINSPASGMDYGYLSEIGIQIQKDGSMTIGSSSDLDAALSTNFSGVASLFGDASQGFAARFESLAQNALQSGGLIAGRESGINDRISSLGRRMEQQEYRLERLEQRFYRQFSSLDAMLGQMNAQSSFLSQQLAGLPGFSR